MQLLTNGKQLSKTDRIISIIKLKTVIFQGFLSSLTKSICFWKIWNFRSFLGNLGKAYVFGKSGISDRFWEIWKKHMFLENPEFPIAFGKSGISDRFYFLVKKV